MRIARKKSAVFALALCIGTVTGQAQTVEVLKRRAELLDHVAKALLAIQFCEEPPRELNPELLAQNRLLMTPEDRKELRDILNDPRIAITVPQTKTRACLFVEENYGEQGRTVRSLLLVDHAKIEARRSAENAKLRAEAEEKQRSDEARRTREEAQAREAAIRWRERLDAMERACVSHIENRGTALKGAKTLDRQVSQKGKDTLFVLRLSLTPDAVPGDFSRTCTGVFGSSKITISGVE